MPKCTYITTFNCSVALASCMQVVLTHVGMETLPSQDVTCRHVYHTAVELILHNYAGRINKHLYTSQGSGADSGVHTYICSCGIRLSVLAPDQSHQWSTLCLCSSKAWICMCIVAWKQEESYQPTYMSTRHEYTYICSWQRLPAIRPQSGLLWQTALICFTYFLERNDILSENYIQPLFYCIF